MANSLNLSADQARAEIAEQKRRIDAGEICSSCLREDCSRELKNHRIPMGTGFIPLMNACEWSARQYAEKITAVTTAERTAAVSGLRILAHIPPTFSDKGFADYKMNMLNGEGLKAAKTFADQIKQRRQDGRGLLLTGSVGTGKTHLACAAINEIIEKGIGGRYFYAPKLLDVLREKLIDETLTKTAYQTIYETPVLLLDELGLADAKDPSWSVSVWNKIIDSRYREKKPTIITTNVGMEELAEAVGARSMSRIIERYEIVEVAGEDYRFKIRMEE